MKLVNLWSVTGEERSNITVLPSHFMEVEPERIDETNIKSVSLLKNLQIPIVRYA